MALSALIQWEVRPTNGTTNAGGGFKAGATGTDFSQQNAVQVAYTDLVIGATTTELTSVLFPFGATHVGNVIAITGGTGFTTGLYEVISVAGVTATMDRSVGTGASTGGTGNLGGARSGFSVGTTTLQASLVAGQIVWVKKEAWNEAVSFTVAGAIGNPITIEGYNAARGDAPIGSNIPTNDRATAGTVAISIAANNYIFKYLRTRRAGTYGFGGAGGQFIVFLGCRSDTNGNSGWLSASAWTLIACEGDSNTGEGYYCNGGQDRLLGCYFHDNSGRGIRDLSNYSAIIRTICESNANHGISITGTFAITITNSIFAYNTGASTDGINIGTTQCVLMNNILVGNGRYGINSTDGDSIWSDYNAFFNNTTAARLNVPVGPHDVTLTGDPFTNGAAGDFSLNNTASAGAACRATGSPGIFPGGLTTGYLDIGSAQHQDTGSSSGGGARLAGIGGLASSG